MTHDFAFQCTGCSGDLVSSDSRLICTACRTNTPLHDGIPSFTNNDDYFFGEIPREAMIELAAAVDRNGWDMAFNEMCENQPPELRHYIRQYIADASRANWKYLLQLPKAGTVLDFGCGWGETTLSLARSVRRVVSMDLTLERLLLLQARSRDQGFTQIAFAHGGDSLPLPFATETFDAVVLNGVLEWVPVTGKGDPRKCQLAVLRELRRILKPSGQLYIGIENRVGLRYFLGQIDEHSQIKYMSLLPRWMADLWSRIQRSKPYRTYTYSRRGYAKLLAEAGFENADFYCPYPDYREFDRVVPATTVDVKQLFSPSSAWKRVLLQLPFSARLLTWAVPSFSIVASCAKPDVSCLHRTINEICDQIGIELATPRSYYSKPIGEIFVYCPAVGEAEPTTLLRIAETQTAIRARLDAARHLESLWQVWHAAGSCMNVIPRSQGYGLLNEIAFTAEEVKQGVSWEKISDYRKSPSTALLAVAGWLTDFQLATRSGETWSSGEMRAHTAGLADRVRSLLPGDHNPLSESDVAAESDIEENCPEEVTVVVCHGDLHLENALFSPKNKRLSGVLDWDLGAMRGLPLTDLIYLLIVYAIDVKQQSYCQAVQSILEPHRLSEPERTVWLKYENAFALDESYRRYAIKTTVLQNIVTLAARRPEAFDRLKDDLSALPNWLIRPMSRSITSLSHQNE